MERSQSYPLHGISPPFRGHYGQPYGANPSYMQYGSNLNFNHYPTPYFLTGSPYPQTNRPSSAPINRLNFTDGMPISNQSTAQSNTNPVTTEESPTSLSSSSPSSTTAESPLAKTTTATLAGAYRGQRSLHSSPDSGVGGNTMYMGGAGFPSPLRAGAQLGTSLLPDPFMPQRLPVGAEGGGYNQNKHISSLLAEIDNQRTESTKVLNCEVLGFNWKKKDYFWKKL